METTANREELTHEPNSNLERVREFCLSFPEAHEVEAWGEPTFRVRNKIFVMYASENTHHSKKCNEVWIKAQKEDQEILLQSASEHYFSPPYVGCKGWIGAYLDENTDWEELQEIIKDGYSQIAPKRLLAQMT